MNGPEVFKFAVKKLTSCLNNIVTEAGMTIHDLDLIIPHQANLRIIERRRQGLQVQALAMTQEVQPAV